MDMITYTFYQRYHALKSEHGCSDGSWIYTHWAALIHVCSWHSSMHACASVCHRQGLLCIIYGQVEAAFSSQAQVLGEIFTLKLTFYINFTYSLLHT